MVHAADGCRVGDPEPAIVAQIAASYDDMAVDADEVGRWRTRQVAAPQLWIGAVDPAGGLVGSVIAEFDAAVGEVALEWVQVLTSQRGRGVGRALVCAALARAKEAGAGFATVSGRVEDVGPERLCRACGFSGDDVWHVYSS
ncbi:GNAT family N-acetyltransferase [Aestuariimicrobium ganziense]|uniref:GNAT family N-acetyltransferase n=1 Tax=Aestuariimicrobium ganziense TaxID=2773677 RepID=UPI00194107E4|nr:GNAT family N-acetyltransferase [Aestuariimicrobium ganziense]